MIDLKNSRAMQTQKGHYPGGFNWHTGFVVDAGNRTSFDLIRKTSNPPGPITPAVFKANTRWLPQLVLLNVLERAETLRYLGKAEYDKRPHEVIDYVDERRRPSRALHRSGNGPAFKVRNIRHRSFFR